MDPTHKLVIAQLTGSLLIAAAVAWTGSQVAAALRSRPMPDASSGAFEATSRDGKASAAASTALNKAPTPIDYQTFDRQWEGRYAEMAAKSCWLPHASRYIELPGHLELKLDVSKAGQVRRVELVGYTNPGDNPNKELVDQVHRCVSAILQAAKFPTFPSDYVVEGRVNRPAPPAGMADPRSASRPPEPPPGAPDASQQAPR